MTKEKSYMCAVPRRAADLKSAVDMIEQLSQARGIKILSHEMEEGLKIALTVDEAEYEIEMYPTKWKMPQLFRTQHIFPDVDVEALDSASVGLEVGMEFGEDALQSYHAQLRIMAALVPDMLAVVDYSSEKILSGKWVVLAAGSKVPPAPRYIYTVQAVSGEDTCVWLHSHGLNRCGITELEVLNSTKENYNQHYNILECLANRLLEEKEAPDFGEPFFLANVAPNLPMIITLTEWEKAVEWFPEDMLGGKADRKEGHNQNTCCIFAYISNQNIKDKVCSPISVFDQYLKNNPIYMITNRETERMKLLAAERLPYMLKAAENPENKILVKIGIAIDEEFREEQNEWEHIWFELLEVRGESLFCRLTQEPYYVKDMHEGSEGAYPFERITDWLIYTKERRISADDAYLLEGVD
ncbi:MAG: DUF4026 domain-containing protein [Candidatus Gastranaerophilales bacterium]|nr:DUF4026 domain-containing protein [Candidatus Gastranaerophilales bacterium]